VSGRTAGGMFAVSDPSPFPPCLRSSSLGTTRARIPVAPLSASDERGMRVALAAAARGAVAGEVPVGAAVMRAESLVWEAHNETVARRDPTAHAELLVIHAALQDLATDRLSDCTLYVTLEPCAQCAGAIVLAKVGKVVFGAYDEKAGMAGSVGDLLRHPKLNHRPEVIGGVLDTECGELLREFFRERRP
jgi:tRNA(adenine34) deaminase